MRRRIPPVEFSHGEPPPELLAFASRWTSPTWTAEDFAAWLRARAAWRDTHAQPLPALPTLERAALTKLDLPSGLVQAEGAAVTRGRTAAELRLAMRDGDEPQAAAQ